MENPTQVVSRPHRDISCFSLHAYDSSCGSFYVIKERGNGWKPELCFPARALGNETILSTGCRLRLNKRDRAKPERGPWNPIVYPGFPGEPIWHGALAGEGVGAQRRTAVVAQLHPHTNMHLYLDVEDYGYKSSPTDCGCAGHGTYETIFAKMKQGGYTSRNTGIY
jgi:hypothetical protein